MEASQNVPITGVLSLDESQLIAFSGREMVSKSEESSSENNNVLETSDSEEGLLYFEGSQSWKNDDQEDEEEEVLPPGTPNYLAKDSHSLTFQWDPCQPPYPVEEDSYSVQIQAMDSKSKTCSILDQDWTVVYIGKECWTKIKDLKPGRYYAIKIRYDWKAKTRIKSIFSSVVIMHTTASIPGALQPPLLVGVDQDSLKFLWRDPTENGGSEIIGFRLQVKLSDSESSSEGFSDVYDGPHHTFNLTQLHPFTKYTIRIKAVNEVGEGPWSLCSSYMTKGSSPEAPVKFQGNFLTPSVILLDWAPLIQSSRNPVQYEIEVQNEKTGFCYYLKTGFENQCEMSEMKCEIEYRLRVRGVNEVGLGSWSLPISVQSSGVPPSAPSCPILTSCSQTEAQFVWNPPLDSGGYPIGFYIAEIMILSPQLSTRLNPGDLISTPWEVVYQDTACECKIEDLSPGQCYCIRIWAKSQAGWSVPSIGLQFQTLLEPPLKTGVPVAIDRSEASLKVQWKVPNQPRMTPIVHYSLECCPVNDLNIKDEVDVEIESFKEVYRGRENVFEVTCLIPGTIYALRVQSIGHTGKSEWSEIGLESTIEDSDHLQVTLQSHTSHSSDISHSSHTFDNSHSSHTSHSFDDSHTSHSFDDSDSSHSFVDSHSSDTFVDSHSSHSFGDSHTFSNDVITDFSASEIGHRSVRLSWIDQSVTKGSIFIVEMSCKRVRDWELCWKGSGTFCLIQGLISSTEYTFRIFDETQGKNRNQQITLQTLPEPPSIPQKLKICQISASSMKIEWEGTRIPFPEKQDSSKIQYLIKITQKQDSSDPLIQSWTSVQESIKIRSLEANTEYEIQIAAENEGGKSDWSETVKTRTKNLPPEPPFNIQTKIIEIENQINVEINWNFVETSKTSQKSQSFEVEVFGLNKNGKKSRNLSNLFSKVSVCSGNSCFIRRLDWDQKYEVRIRGVDPSDIPGPWSKPFQFHTFSLNSKSEKCASSELQTGPKLSQDGVLSSLGSSHVSKKSKRGQVVIPNKRTYPLKRRKSLLRVFRSHSGALLVFTLFLFVSMLIYLTPVN